MATETLQHITRAKCSLFNGEEFVSLWGIYFEGLPILCLKVHQQMKIIRNGAWQSECQRVPSADPLWGLMTLCVVSREDLQLLLTPDVSDPPHSWCCWSIPPYGICFCGVSPYCTPYSKGTGACSPLGRISWLAVWRVSQGPSGGGNCGDHVFILCIIIYQFSPFDLYLWTQRTSFDRGLGSVGVYIKQEMQWNHIYTDSLIKIIIWRVSGKTSVVKTLTV